MEETFARARCSSCGRGLAFEEWTRGLERCAACSSRSQGPGPAATYVRGPATPAGGSLRTSARAQAAATYAERERLVDEIPEELVNELVAMLEAEAERRKTEVSAPHAAIEEMLEEIGFGRSPRELQWAAWGFAAGFALNVALAKYAQMTTASSMAEFVMPMLFGGVLAGAACAAIGWGLARLSER